MTDLMPLMKEIGRRLMTGEASDEGCEINGDGNAGTIEIIQRWKLETPEAIEAVERAMDEALNAGNQDDDRARRIRAKFVTFGPDVGASMVRARASIERLRHLPPNPPHD